MKPELDRWLSEGRGAYEREDFAQAEDYLNRALEGGASGYADVHHMLGVIYHSWGMFSKARASFEQALGINPSYTEAALNLSITYNDLGRYAEAQEVLKKALPNEDSDTPLNALTKAKIANMHAAVGDAYRSADLPKEAAIEYRRALGLCPHFVDIRRRLSEALTEAGDDSGAIEELRLALRDNPNYIPAMLQLGLFLRGREDHEGAREMFRKVLDLRPDHERASTYLRMLDPLEADDASD